MDILLYILAFLALVQGAISLRDGRRNLKYSFNYERVPPSDRPVVVFCPVKGSDPELGENVASLMGQSHTDYRVVFIVDSVADPSMPILSASRGEVLIAGRAERCGQKVHNLIHGVLTAGEGAETFVFCDADARFPPDWLRQLLAPLGDPRVGATTGYRWYAASGRNFSTRLRSAWNAAVAGFLGPHSNNFVWGGSTAIRRVVFEEAGVLDRWRGALSDDYVLTEAVRGAGLRIVYVPLCLVPSYGECSWPQLMEFTTRQILITRVYAPKIWKMGLVTYSLFNLTFLWLTFRMFSDWKFFLLWSLVYGLAIVRADLRVRAAGRVLGDLSLDRWFYRLSPPLVALLYEWNFIRTIVGRRLVWKGITYTLLSAGETRVES